jgi:hypothetical protein
MGKITRRLIRPTTALIAAAVLSAAAFAAAQHPMRPGNWETTVEMQMPNMPMAMAPMKTTSCVTAEQLKMDPAAGLSAGDPKNACKVTEQKITGSTVAWKVTCPAQKMDGTGELAFKGDTYTGTVTMTAPMGAMTMKMAGRRLGDCAQ